MGTFCVVGSVLRCYLGRWQAHAGTLDEQTVADLAASTAFGFQRPRRAPK